MFASFNIRYDAKSDRGERDWRGLVSDTIVKMAADVLGLQEVRHSQLMDLRSAHPEVEVVGVAWDDEQIRGEYSSVFFAKSAFG